jgi:hypothetical protein
VAIRRRLERSCSKLRTSVRHEGQPARAGLTGASPELRVSCPPGAHDNRSVAEVGDRCLSLFGWSRFGASGTDWDEHDAAAHKSPDRRAAPACDKGVPVVRTTANVVL